MAMKRFIRTLVIATLVVIVVSVIVYAALPVEYYPQSFLYLIVFFFAATLLVYYFMLKSLEKRPAKFVNIFLVLGSPVFHNIQADFDCGNGFIQTLKHSITCRSF